MTTRPLGTGDSFIPRPRTTELPDPGGQAPEATARGDGSQASMKAHAANRRDELRVTRPLTHPGAAHSGSLSLPDGKDAATRPRTLWERMKNAMSGTAGLNQEASDLARAVKHEVEEFEETVIEAGRKLYEKILDPFIDGTPLGSDDEFQDAGGALSKLLTNRLALGESASIRLAAGGDIPTEFLAMPNVKLDGGGTVEIKRVPRKDAMGNALSEPRDAHGNPPTELEVKLTLENRTGLAYEAAIGARAGFQFGKHTAGISATAEASVEAGAAGKLTYTFSFDPTKASHMNTLSGLVGSVAQREIRDQMPDLAREMPGKPRGSWLDHLTSLEGEGGLYAQASAAAEARIGLTKLELETDGETIRSSTRGRPNFDRSAGVLAEPHVDSLKEAGMDQLLEKLGFPVSEIGASLGGEARMGVRKDLRTGDQTVYVNVNGEAGADTNAFGLGKEAGASSNRRLALQYDREGKLKNVSVEESHSKERFQGIRTTIEDVFGRPLDEGFVASVGDEDTVQVKYNLKPEMLAKYARRLEGSSTDRASALRDLAAIAVSRQTMQLEVPDLVARHTDAFELGGEVGLKLLGAVAVRGNMTLARSQETQLASGPTPRR